ncbi:MAG: glycosyltransferase family 2 protein, partial [Candidatus Roizmanbacteria bacterium]|nr:glycosyltransferase family 2 protein [Candidatus Roizmanbacteria bacterium]
MDHSLAIITPVYQNYEVLQDFFSYLEKQTNKNFQIFLIDLSIDKKPIINKKLNISVIKEDNLGYAYGVNIGINEAIKSGFGKFCVMNNDTYMANDFVDQVIKSVDKNPVSLIGGKIYYAPGYEYHHTRYKKSDLGKVFWYAGGIMDWKNVFTNHRGVDMVDHGQFEKIEETDFITGCLISFDRSVWDQVGPWNENYFLYFEDADYCERSRRKGLKLLYDPKIVLWHKVSQSTGGSGSVFHKKY